MYAHKVLGSALVPVFSVLFTLAILFLAEIMPKTLGKPETPVRSIARPISFVSEDSNCLPLLTEFLQRRSHISVIHDEYGGVRGVVTLEDLLETILGMEIVDETDRVADLQKLARKRTGGIKRGRKTPSQKESPDE